MKTFKEIFPLKAEIFKTKQAGKRIGFVPTMGNLHEGHLSLLRKSVEENEVSVLSIYVNPTQFGAGEDYKDYPRTLDEDLILARETGCDYVFVPNNETMYPGGFSTYVNEEVLSQPMCGERRPGHFRGVTTVVAKLFHIVEPHAAYFGQKDAQQALVIKKMVKDLDLNVEIRVLPIIREKNGLAMSSRNNYLSKDDRDRASIIYEALSNGQKLFEQGERNSQKIRQAVWDTLKKEPSLVIDYLDMRSTEDLSPVEENIKSKTLLAVGATMKGVHLIDNIVLPE